MSERKANPIVAPLITTPGASKKFTGTRDITGLLPNVFQTEVNKQFLDTTLEQLLSTGSLQPVKNYVGQKFFKDTVNTSYIDDSRADDNYQFVPALVNKDQTNQNAITQVLPYNDLLNTLKYNEVDINNHSKLLNEKGYTLDIPINYDMFINYHKYFWLLDTLPPASIKATSTDIIDIDTLIGEVNYTTPALSTSNTLALQNGMRIRFMPTQIDRFTQSSSGNTTFTATVTTAQTLKVYKNNLLQTLTTHYSYNSATGVVTFATAPALTDEIEIHTFYSKSTSGNYPVGDIYIVDGVGDANGIKLTRQFISGQVEGSYSDRVWINHTVYSSQEPTGFDETASSFDFRPFDLQEYKMTTRDYVVEQRYSADQSAWARSNLWVHEDTARAIITFENLVDTDYLKDSVRAVRPIIEYKASIEKYNFGKRHIANVTYLIEDNTIDPATAIVGQTAYDWNITGINTAWTAGVGGSEVGDQYYVDLGTSPNTKRTYWQCIKNHITARNPIHGENYEYWKQITPQELENGDSILFLRNGNTTYNEKIFTVGGIGSSITLTEIFGPSSTNIVTNDKVVVINAFNTTKFDDGEEAKAFGGSEWYHNGTTWVYGQQKTHRSEGMLAELYDLDGVILSNTTVYPENNFTGACIFDYVHNDSNAKDDALGFSPSYADYGNSPGLNFSMPFLSNRFTYTKVSSDGLRSLNQEIIGQYFYRDFDGNAFNGWSLVRGGQPVKRTISKTVTSANSQLPMVFDLGYTDFATDRHVTMFKRHGFINVKTQKDTGLTNVLTDVNGKYPELFFSTNTTYNITTQFAQSEVEFVNIDGSAIGSGLTRTAGSGNDFTIVVTSPTVTAIKYRLSATPNSFGVIYFNTIANDTDIKVFRNRIETSNYTLSNNILTINGGLAVDDIYEVEYHTHNTYSDSAEGFQQASDTHLLNPQNNSFTNITFGDLIEHMREQMTSIPGFTGGYFGTNNYRNLPHVHEFGGTIRQQPYSTELLSQLLMDTDTNLYASIKHASNNYSMFLKKFATKAVQIHKTLDTTKSTYEMVDKILEEMNLGKNKEMQFAQSNMALYRDYESKDYSFQTTMTKVFDLPQSVNTYDDTENHVQVWVQDDDGAGNLRWRSLIKDIDYTLDSNKVTITGSVAYPSSGVAKTHIRWYKRDSVSFVPNSAVKLGLIKPYTPELRSDYSESSNGTATTNVITRHDGSIHIRKGTEIYDRSKAGYDPVDAAIFDLECRIYNNLNSTLDNVDNIKNYMPNAHRANRYSWTQIQNSIVSEFNKWKVANSYTDLQSTTYYSGADKFTWNYSSVSPNIGGWRGIYHYFFNTDRPHTHPWEMLGHNKKPTWWNTYYSWTNAPKRSALITALRYGKVNDPSTNDVFDINYSYDNYDWANNTLVTNTATLNDPDTANVVSTPTLANRTKDFVYGDWGPVEAEWRRSPEYRIAEFLSLAKTRPLIAVNNYFKLNERSTKDLTSYDKPQIYSVDSKKLSNFKATGVSGVLQTGKIIESVIVKNGGTGYTSAPTIVINDNFGSGATLTAFVQNGSVVSVSVTNAGKDYYNNPKLTLSSGSAVLETVLAEEPKRYFGGLQNAVIEFAKSLNVGSTTIQTRMSSMDFNPIVKAGGFVNNNQKFMLESSQDKGRVFVPEENFTTILFNSKPTAEYFISGVIVDKVATGYKINGYDNDKMFFEYFKPNTASAPIKQTFSVDIFRYNEYATTKTILNYNTILPTMQDVYNFLLGYGECLAQQGFTQNWRGSASNFINYAIGSTTDTLYLIPDNSKIIVNDGADGYFDNLESKYDGIFNINNKLGQKIQPTDLIIDRNLMIPSSDTTFKVKKSTTQIFGLRLYKTSVEHLIVFDNTTNFDDTIYNASIGQRHKRIQWNGSRTKDWNGKFYSPGFIVTDNTIISNFDSLAEQTDQYLGRTKTLSNSQVSDVARFNIGYNPPSWANNLDLDEDSLFEFVKGTYKYKGTKYALDAFLKNKGLFDGDSTGELYEEWAVRMGDFGDTRSRETLEFELTPDLLITSPQPVRFFSTQKYDVLTDTTIDIDTKSPLLVTGTPGDYFDTRAVKTYTETGITAEDAFANDFVSAGLPLLTEADFKVLNREGLLAFPNTINSEYDFTGDWEKPTPWETNVSYKFNDQIMYNGSTWEMVDPKGYSGLATSSQPIEVVGTITLPIVPASGGTLIIDGNTISLTKSTTQTTLNVINKIGTQDIATSNVVTHGSTLILGATSALSSTITFQNSSSNVTYNNITKDGIVSNPSFVGSATKTLIIDGNTITFDDTVSTTNNITAQTALENAFNANGLSNVTTLATNRINALESLRLGYVSANSASAWTTFMTDYFNPSNAGIDLTLLLNAYNTNPAYKTQLGSLITSDVAIINANQGTSYVAIDVLAGTSVVASSDITATQNAIDNGTHIAAFATYIKANPTVVLATSTVVTTTSGTTFKTYTLADIVQKINSAGIGNLTASNSSNFLRLVKTTSTPAVQFTLVISAGTANTDVGFQSATETITSTSSTTVTNPNLTLAQVVQQINDAGISNISAVVNSANNNLLQINCSASSLFIGTGTANSIVGLTTGVTPAGTTSTTINVALDINDIVDKINTTTISGVTASNSNNRLKLTSNNSTLVIGAGTSNATVGLTAQTYTAATSVVSNVFNAIVNGVEVFKEMTNDPNVFSIWVADDSEFGSFNKGYQVYQTMDFGMYISNACAGPTNADDAEVTVARSPSTVTQAHNLVAGDYVLIRGSTTTPSIDGIHKVTFVDSANNAKFFIDEYIESEGKLGNIYPLRPVRFSSKTELDTVYNLKVNGVHKYNFNGVRQNNSLNKINIFVDDDSYDKSAVYNWSGDYTDANGHHNGSFTQTRTGQAQSLPTTNLQVKLYDARARTSIANLEIWDPAKGIIFGFIDKEIDYKLINDIGSYNYNTLNGEMTNLNAWKDEYVGVRWWDLSTAVYLDYEQSIIEYQQTNWGRLFPGASIDVYEWTRSTVLPEFWSQAVEDGIIIDGQEASGEAYFTIVNNEKVYNWTQQTYYNPKTRRDEVVYYFWVKNKLNYAGIRQYNVSQISQILKNPSAFDIAWAAPSLSNQLLLNNVSNFVTKNTVVQVTKNYTATNSMPLNDWTLLGEGDPNCYIPEYLHIKMRDSLAGFNNHTFDTTYSTWSNSTSYSVDAVVIRNGKYYISRKSSNQGSDPALDTAMTNWQQIYDFTFDDTTQIDDIKIWRGQHLPDYNLHPYNRYGHLIRPRQSLFRDVAEARQNFVFTVNDLLGEVNLIDEVVNWKNCFHATFEKGNVTYNIKDYVTLVDWNLVERDSDGNVTFEFNPNTVADFTFDSDTDRLNFIGNIPDGSYILIKTNQGNDGINRQRMLLFTGGVDKLVSMEKATVNLSEELWLESKFGHGFDAGGFGVLPYDSGSNDVIGKLMDLLRSEIFVHRHKVMYNRMWFKLLYSAILQNTTDDFAFKTSYVKLRVKHPLLTNKETYQRYQISVVEDYFESIKPFHTKLLDLTESNTHIEATMAEMEEVSRQTAITMIYNDHTLCEWNGDEILDGGLFTTDMETTATNIDESSFTTLDSSYDNIADGDIFANPRYQYCDGELYPTDFTENIAIAVQTNLPGTVTAGATYSVNAQETNPRGITFNTNGTKMFIIGTTGDDVNEYTLSTGFDLTSTVAFVDSYAVTQCPNPTAVKFNSDGTKMFVTGTGNSNVHEYALTTGFDVSTASFTQTLVTTVDSDNFGLDFKDDGTKMYITGDQNNKIYEYNLSSAFDISTATFNQDLTMTAIDVEPFGIEWSPDGKRLFVVGTRGNGVDLWKLTTPWDISTATHEEFYFIGGNPSGIHISPDGHNMFITGNNADLVKSYALSSPYAFTEGSQLTSDSRTYRMSMYMPNNIQLSNVIVDTNKTTTTAAVTGLDTTIPVTDATKLDNPDTVYGTGEVPGVVYIGSERIEYSAISGNNLLFCTRGTLGTSAKAHDSGATVVNSGATTRIPILEKFSDYGDNLRLAYNDSGISLSAAGISPEHAFIRNAGQGSI